MARRAILKMEATCQSETSVDFEQTTRHYITGDRTFLYNNRICIFGEILDYIKRCNISLKYVNWMIILYTPHRERK
jgi:hypothetical protein